MTPREELSKLQCENGDIERERSKIDISFNNKQKELQEKEKKISESTIQRLSIGTNKTVQMDVNGRVLIKDSCETLLILDSDETETLYAWLKNNGFSAYYFNGTKRNSVGIKE